MFSGSFSTCLDDAGRRWLRASLTVVLCGLLLAVSAATSPAVYAQQAPADCPTLVNDALLAVGEACSGLGRNEICYGNNQVFAFDAAATALTDFAIAGDRTAVQAVSSLQTTPLDVQAGLWGVAVLALQANIPDTLPGQNVTFLIFGDSSITADPEAAGTELTAPMQAFRIRTGIGEPACAEAPRDGVLVQSPKGVTVNFRVNGLDVEIASTVLMDVRKDEKVWISTLEGQAKVTSAGETQIALPGQIVVTIPGQPPAPPKPYTYSEIAAMPVQLLPDPVVIPFTVPALAGTEAWLTSDFVVEAGQTYTITTGGTADIYPACEAEGMLEAPLTCADMRFGPEGSATMTAGAGYPLPGAPIGALIARVGETGTPFLPADSLAYTADAEGVLQFRLNDLYYAEDNTGGFSVVVEVAD